MNRPPPVPQGRSAGPVVQGVPGRDRLDGDLDRGAARGHALGGRGDDRSAGLSRATALLTEGPPNREIFQRLFISERTVDHHVSAVLSKIGVSSRTAAVREAARLGIGASLGAT